VDKWPAGGGVRDSCAKGTHRMAVDRKPESHLEDDFVGYGRLGSCAKPHEERRLSEARRDQASSWAAVPT
jgi:hypothetical protein